MIVIGLTGGIASGKTTIMNFLKKKKFAVHDSDAVVKKIYSKPEPKFLSYLKKTNLKNGISKRYNVSHMGRRLAGYTCAKRQPASMRPNERSE